MTEVDEVGFAVKGNRECEIQPALGRIRCFLQHWFGVDSDVDDGCLMQAQFPEESLEPDRVIGVSLVGRAFGATP